MDCSTLLGVMMEVQTCIQLNTTILQAIHGHLFQPQWKLVEGNTFNSLFITEIHRRDLYSKCYQFLSTHVIEINYIFMIEYLAF